MVDDCVFTNAVEAKCAADMVNLRTRRGDDSSKPPVVVVRCHCWGRCRRARDGSLSFTHTQLLGVVPNRCALCELELPVHTPSGAPYPGTS